MVKRLFLTPPDLPATTTTRCIEIPNSREWLGIFNAALLLTAQAHNYEQVHETDLTPQDVANRCFEIYVQYLEGCSDMDCNDVMACFMAANITPLEGVDIRADPVTGDPQFSADGGTTWTDIPGDPDAPPHTPPLEATPGATDDAKRCLAASRAATVLDTFYQQTYGAFTAGLFNVLRDVNTFLYNLNNALLGIAYGQAAQAANAITWYGFDWSTHATAPSLTAQQFEDLLCLLYDNATADAAGIVTFDYQAIADNLITTLGVNPGTALLTLVAYIQAPGLNQAGQVEAVAQGAEDCSPCEQIVCPTDGTPTFQDYAFNDPGWNYIGTFAGNNCGGGPTYQWNVTAQELIFDLGELKCVTAVQFLFRYVQASTSTRVTSAEVRVDDTVIYTGSLVTGTNCGTLQVYSNAAAPVQGRFIKIKGLNGSAFVFRTFRVWTVEPEG